MAREVIEEEDDHHRVSRVTPSASPPPRWRPRVGGVLLGLREEQRGGVVDHHDERHAVAAAAVPGGILLGGGSLPTTPRPHPDAVRGLPFVTRKRQQLGGGVDYHDERTAVADPGGILLGEALLPTTPRPHPDAVRRLPFVTRHPQQRSGVDHQEGRDVADARGILPCGASLCTSPRPQTDAVSVPSDGRRLHLVPPQRPASKVPDVVVVIDDHDDHCLFLAPPPAGKKDTFGGESRRCLFPTPAAAAAQVFPDDQDEEDGDFSTLPPLCDDDDDGHCLPSFDPFFLTPPPAGKTDTFGVGESRRALLSTPFAAASGSSPVFRDPFEIRDAEDEEDDDVSTLPPAKRRQQTDAVSVPSDGCRLVTPNPQRAIAKAPEVVVLSDDDDEDLSLPSFDGCCPFFLTPPAAGKTDTSGSRRAMFVTPPAAAACSRPATLPPPKRRTSFLDPVKIVDGEGDVDDTVSSTLTKLPPCKGSGFNCGNGGRGSSSCVQGGSRRGRGDLVVGGRSSASVQAGVAGRGCRARALAELLGDADSKLKPDSGPAPGQILRDWQFERNLDLNGEYEYLDGLLTRINELPEGKGGRVTALARKGWVEFYTRLEVCMVVRRQMKEAKAEPTPVPKRLMAEVR